ncbi:MAG: nucleotidyltransferase domain-containing protein [Candidatus Korarchaeota archaeon]|nr:nucleotidyltransferase domain-containing protein [Candidatus Korarchaeota archaeon]
MDLRKLVNRIRERYRVYAIILFGSRARGDWLPHSDYDLLIVADFQEPFLDRVYELSGLAEGPVESHPYTLDEVRELLRRGVPSIVDALEEGIVLYEGEEFREVRELFEEMKRKGLRRSGVSIILPGSDQP